jgi:hypothetical protein
LTVTTMSIDEVYEMINDNKITDAITVAAILKLKIMMLEK